MKTWKCFALLIRMLLLVFACHGVAIARCRTIAFNFTPTRADVFSTTRGIHDFKCDVLLAMQMVGRSYRWKTSSHLRDLSLSSTTVPPPACKLQGGLAEMTFRRRDARGVTGGRHRAMCLMPPTLHPVSTHACTQGDSLKRI